jgi:hypothetical protein
MRLPIDATQKEGAVAWKANGGTLIPLNVGKVFAALVEAIQGEKSVTYEAAIDLAKGRFTQLWDLVQRVANTSFAV